MHIKTLRVLAAYHFGLHWFTVGIAIPVLSLFLINKGFTLLQVGYAFAVYSGTTVILELPTGGLSDTFGRKRVYLISLLLQGVGALLIIVVHAVPAVILCFAFQGAARSLSSGTMDAYFIDQFYSADPQIHLQRELARIGFFVPASLAIGSLIGGILPGLLKRVMEGLGLENEYSANYLVILVFLGIQFLSTVLLIQEDPVHRTGSTWQDRFRQFPEVVGTSVRLGLRNSIILLLLLTMFCWGFSVAALEQFWQPQLKSFMSPDSGSFLFGLLTFGYFAAAAGGSLLALPLGLLFKDHHALLLFASRLTMGILYGILALQRQIAPFALLYISLFLFNGIQGSPESALFNREIPSEKRSTLLSFASLFLQTGGIAGSILFGLLAERCSIAAAWLAAAAVLTLSAAIYLRIHTLERKAGYSSRQLPEPASMDPKNHEERSGSS